MALTFNDRANPKIRTENFKIYIDVSETGLAPVWELQGKGVASWTIDRGEEITKTKDVLGGVETERGTPEPTQTGVKIYLRKGSKFAEMLAEADFTGDTSKLDAVKILKKYEYMDGKEANTCRAKLENDVMVGLPTFDGEAGGYLAYTVDFHYANRFETGTMPKVDGETIVFEPDTESESTEE
jgi:hypothetical protein